METKRQRWLRHQVDLLKAEKLLLNEQDKVANQKEIRKKLNLIEVYQDELNEPKNDKKIGAKITDVKDLFNLDNPIHHRILETLRRREITTVEQLKKTPLKYLSNLGKKSQEEIEYQLSILEIPTKEQDEARHIISCCYETLTEVLESKNDLKTEVDIGGIKFGILPLSASEYAEQVLELFETIIEKKKFLELDYSKDMEIWNTMRKKLFCA